MASGAVLYRKVIDYSTAAGSRNQQTWLLDPCMRLTKFGKAIGKGLRVKTHTLSSPAAFGDGLETWVKVAQGTSPTYTASHDPQGRSREVHFGHRGREA